MMKKFAFLLVCLVFSSSIIGMARAADEENGGTGENGGAGENGGTGENENVVQTTTTTTEAPDVTTKNGTVEKVTDAPVISEGPNTTTTTTTEKVTTTTGSGSAGFLPSLFVVVATAIAGYNFGC